jgi:hypothetical protein
VPHCRIEPASAQQECWLQSAGPAFGLRPSEKDSIFAFCSPILDWGGNSTCRVGYSNGREPPRMLPPAWSQSLKTGVGTLGCGLGNL